MEKVDRIQRIYYTTIKYICIYASIRHYELIDKTAIEGCFKSHCVKRHGKHFNYFNCFVYERLKSLEWNVDDLRIVVTCYRIIIRSCTYNYLFI